MANSKLSVKLSKDSGASTSDFITNTGDLKVAGALKGDNLFYRYSSDNGLSWSTWTGTTGNIPQAPKDGTWLFQVQERSKNGAVVETLNISYTLDRVALAPTVQLANDTGASQTDGITQLGDLIVKAEAGAKVQYSTDGGSVWSSNFKAVEGLNQVLVRQSDLAGNLSASTLIKFTLDTQTGAAPVANLSSDTGLVDGDLISQSGELTIVAEAGARVEYSTNGTDWSTSFTPQEGVNTVYLRQVDLAGNVSPTGSLSFTVDTTAPQATDDWVEAVVNTPVVLSPLDNDSDNVSELWLTSAEELSANGGSVILNGDGTLTYQAADGFTGFDWFYYTVADAAGNTTDGVVQINVSSETSTGGSGETNPPPAIDAFTAFDNTQHTVGQLTQALLGLDSGVTVVDGSVELHNSGAGATNFYNGALGPLGIGAGLLLTSGTTPGTSNTETYFGTDNGGVYGEPGFDNGDADLDAVVNTVFGTTSYDATTLSFDFTVADTEAKSVTFDLVFGSEEYPEWVDQFVDCAVVMVNGQNVAYFNHSEYNPLSVIGSNLSAGYFQNNLGQLPIEYDGVSKVLTIVAPIVQGTNSIKIGIGDTGDHVYDSGIFISNLRATNTEGSGVLVKVEDASSSDDTLLGNDTSELADLGDGNDSMDGALGDDIISGGNGDDALKGGKGGDYLTGGSGADLFEYTESADWAAFDNSYDVITDFTGNTTAISNTAAVVGLDGDVLVFSYNDLINLAGTSWAADTAPLSACFSTLDAAYLSSLTDGTADANHAQFVYDAQSGWVSFDADGTGEQLAYKITLLGSLPASLTATSFLLEG
ncbi:MAG: hypothetical protein RI959_770 [Pseudomonadota bacterium]